MILVSTVLVLIAVSVALVFPECTAAVRALFIGGQQVAEVVPGQRCLLILDRTCFYAEQGGQSHDQGYLSRHTSPVRTASRNASNLVT